MTKSSILSRCLAAVFVMTTVVIVMVSCAKQTPPPPAAEENPLELLKKLSAGIKADPADSAQARCLAKQKARLEACGSKSGQERAICEAVAKELIKVCEEMNPNVPAVVASGLFCSGICALRQCPAPGCPLPTGWPLSRKCLRRSKQTGV